MSVLRGQLLGPAAVNRGCRVPQQVPHTSYQGDERTGAYLRHQLATSLLGPCKRPIKTSAAGGNGAESAPVGSSGSSGGLAVAPKTEVGRVIDTALRTEVEKSYLAYAMSVIVGRALPDVRDGLKPVHRRILFAMHDLGLSPNKPFRKSARVVGEVLGKYHPHGDTAVYDALVRLAQPFSMRLPLVNGHGNFGSQDNDPAAAMRYTECRLQQASTSALLADLEFDTVDFHDTFDGAQQEPIVLPARLPNLIINGSQGIAVGMATNIPPHNVGEVVSALEALIKNPDISTTELLTYIPAPDFPTGGEIVATSGIEEAYRSGRGPITLRGRAFVEEEGKSSGGARGSKRSVSSKSVIVVTELPYQTNKASLVEHIAKLTDDGTLQGLLALLDQPSTDTIPQEECIKFAGVEGISDVRDESDRDGMRVVVEVKRGFNAEVVLNNLYKHTQLQKRFACNLVALVNGSPQTLGLREFLSHFLDFRCRVVTRRAQFGLQRSERRVHIVEGLLKAQEQLERVVNAIRKAPDGPAAARALQSSFGLSAEQADAVLSMALRRLTSLEAGKLQQEEAELQASISALRELLGSRQAIQDTVAREARELAASLGNERRTLVRSDVDGKLEQEDIIPNRQSLVVFSRRGYIKRMPADHFSTQSRGGKGQKVASLRDNDTVEEMQVVRDHQNLLFFTTDGQAFCVKAYEIPHSSRTASGTALPQVLKVRKDQKVTAMVPVDELSGDEHLMLMTQRGYVKRVRLSEFATARQGTAAMGLTKGDQLVWVRKCNVDDDLILAMSDGMVSRYSVELFRPMGRKARGLQSVQLSPDVDIVGMTVLKHQIESSSGEDEEEEEVVVEEESEVVATGDGPNILFVTEKGQGKQVPAELFRSYSNRKAKGVIGIKLAGGDRLAAFHVVSDESEVLLSTSNGLLTRIALSSVTTLSRSARGVILMRTKDAADKISSVSLVAPSGEGET